jgi:hypothetical protein
MSTGGERRWAKLAELAEKEHDPEKRLDIVQELCMELTALQKQLVSAKAQACKRYRNNRERRDCRGVN